VADHDTSAPASAGAAASATRRKARARRKVGTRKKTAARRKPASAARSRDAGLSTFLAGLSRQAARAGSRIASISEEGVSGARRTLGKAGTASKKTIQRLTREWKQMDTKKRAQFVAALLGALAAASAPLVRRKFKK
jgi:hypothetical protein